MEWRGQKAENGGVSDILISIEQIVFRMEEQDSRQFLRIVGGWQEGDSDSLQRDSPTPPLPATDLHSPLTHLHRAKERFKAFVRDIGEFALTPIREDILAYCGNQKKPEKCIDEQIRPQCLLRKIQIRIDKMLKTKKLKRNWGEDDLKILVWVVSKYGEVKELQDLEKDITAEDWKFIASIIPGVTAEACMFKWLSIKKITLATHNWTKQQSQLLARIVKERLVGCENWSEIRDWKQISQELYGQNDDLAKVFRNAKQCREHWTCYLSPQLKKGPWQLYEDVKLLKFIKDNKGLKKWSEIAKHFEGRTENALKNRYTLIIDKQKRLPRNKNKNELTLISEYLQKCYVDQFTTNVKIEEDQDEQEESIYREESSARHYPEDQIIVKREEVQTDANQSAITPLRVQKFSINDFEAMNLNFFKHIQPGVIKSDGTFKKIPSTVFPESNERQECPITAKIEEDTTSKNGPFTILPLQA